VVRFLEMLTTGYKGRQRPWRTLEDTRIALATMEDVYGCLEWNATKTTANVIHDVLMHARRNGEVPKDL
jgi:hypothetical protein